MFSAQCNTRYCRYMVRKQKIKHEAMLLKILAFMLFSIQRAKYIPFLFYVQF